MHRRDQTPIVSSDYRREYADDLAVGMSPIELDRQRIVHSAAFRRLQYKTQVFVATEQDHFRTRLTHTLEVANLARLIATRLTASGVAADPDLAEVVALAHDLGHPPFGHAGERALAECMKDFGGFEHNVQSLRVVEYLEHPYPAFRGLNLTHVVRECLAKHSTAYDKPAWHPLQDGRPAPPEGQVADVADRLAYGLHDLQDGLYAGLIERDELETVALWKRAYAGPPAGSVEKWWGHIRPTIDRIQEFLVEDVVKAAGRDRANPSVGVSRQASPPVGVSPEMEECIREMEQLLLRAVYRNHKLRRMDSKARRIVTAVFEAYVEEPELMPERYAGRVAEQGVQRVAADYIAGMTDRFCIREHARLFDPRMDV